MRKYKLLRFGHCYSNQEGDFVIGLLGGDKKHGYTFAASHAHPYAMLGRIYIQSRVVPNDGHWIEIDPAMFNVASAVHVSGHKVKFPAGKSGEFPVISKY